jgi:sodium transport system permease protein
MRWSKVKLIFLRECRDQLRDRRTLFTVAVLPLLLYPLMGMSFLQVAQFLHEHPVSIWIVGSEHIADGPPLIVDGKFSSDFCSADEARLLTLEIEPAGQQASPPDALREAASGKVQDGDYAVAILFPPDMAELFSDEDVAEAPSAAADETSDHAAPQPQIIFNLADDRSRIAFQRASSVIENWRQAIVLRNLQRRNIPASTAEPFTVSDVDVSAEGQRRTAMWSKILPLIVLVWALTGAFYPAVDLCAGEKERGTLETLLSSPAERGEIVWGKLLTIMLFSSATSLLNLVAMSVTGTVIVLLQPNQIPIGAPPLGAIGWLLLALLPISALFSALSLAIAAFARSTKEGQYYLMPLLLISLPLMILSILPSVELNLGNSLIPITGMMLLLRALVDGQYLTAMTFAPPVLMVTLGACLLAIRWAVGQFNNESVLFRESERWGLQPWLRHVVRDRGPTPTFAHAIACGVILLTIRFFATFAAEMPETWNDFVRLQAITLIGLVAAPALVMTILLTRSPRATLLLRMPRAAAILLAMLLAVALHPVAMVVAQGVERLYPIGENMQQQVGLYQQIIAQAPSIWAILALMALMPAICEELAFRGFILSGLRHVGRKWTAIVISSVLFGLAHGILQQSIAATLVGIVIGYLAVQTGSLLPCVGFHLVYNSMSLVMSLRVPAAMTDQPWLRWIYERSGESVSYHWPVILVATVLATLLLWWFRRQPYSRTEEEQLQEALDRQKPATMRYEAATTR